jgi:hypothetical protein
VLFDCYGLLYGWSGDLSTLFRRKIYPVKAKRAEALAPEGLSGYTAWGKIFARGMQCPTPVFRLSG